MTNLERRRVSSGSAYEPVIGFSRAVRVGDTIHVAGTGPVFPDGNCPDDAYLQTQRAFAIALAAIEELGGSATDVVRTRMFMTNAAEWEEVGKAHGEAFGAARPAATMVVVAALLDERWKVEIEVDAVIG